MGAVAELARWLGNWVAGNGALDWAILTISVFNTILLLWLGLALLLTAERRGPALVLAGGGLLLGGAFFLSHSAILGRGLRYSGPWMDFWWHLAWLPAVFAPLAWYLIMLWYAGFWDDPRSALHRQQRPFLVLLGGAAAGLIALLFFLPSYTQLIRYDLSTTPSFGGVPLVVLCYPLYVVLCVVLSLDALRRPIPSGRVMGDLARERARPWLVATAGALIVVSLLVAGGMVWFIGDAHQLPNYRLTAVGIPLPLAALDLVAAGCIAVAVLLLGQALVAYEIFTGKTLPRRGLLRQWRRIVLLAAGFSAVVGGILTLQIHPIYGLLVATVLITLFYGLFSWRVYAERERYMEQLRPFVTSPRLYEELLDRSADGAPDVDVETPFRALCAQVLGARTAYLAAVGPLAPLVGPPWAYPAGQPPPPLSPDLLAPFTSPQTLYGAVDPARYGGAGWAVPLWSERGLAGVLLLGDKRDGGLYTQEEIELARASGERLIDTRASAALAQRLMALQRQRLAESQVLDRQTRRVLHDDVLPRLHTVMLKLSAGEANGTTPQALALLGEVHRQISDLLHALPPTAAPAVARLGLIGALQQAVDSELGAAFDGVRWEIAPDAAQAVQSIPPLTAEVLFYAAREAIRNAARYGRDGDSARPLHLQVGVAWRDGLELCIQDDGVGMGADPPAPGGGGHGLALHSTMMAVVGGALATDTLPGQYTRVTLTLPRQTW